MNRIMRTVMNSYVNAHWIGTSCRRVGLCIMLAGASALMVPGTAPAAPPAANLTLWLAADQMPGLTDGQSVSLWTNLSSLVAEHVTQGTLANQPVFRASQVNGKPAVEFDGTGDILGTASGLSAFMTATQYTAVVVYRADTVTRAGHYTGHQMVSDGYNGNFALGLNTDSPYNNAFLYNWGGADKAANVSSRGSEWHYLVGRLDTGLVGAALTVWADVFGTGTNSAAALAGVTRPIKIGDGFDGMIAEVLVYNTALSDSLVNDLRTYIEGKYGIREPAAAAGLPTDTMTLWLAADHIQGGTDGGTVAAWANDAPGNHPYFKMNTEASKPAFRTNQLNGLPGMRFDGLNDYMQATAEPLSALITGSEFTLFAVFNAASSDSSAPASYNNAIIIADNAMWWGLHMKSSNVLMFSYGLGDDHADNSVTLGTWHMVSARHAGGALYAHLDGGSDVTVAAGDTGSLGGTIINVGGKGTLASSFDGSLAELIIYRNALSASDRQIVERHLATKYNAFLPPALDAGTTFILR